MNLQEKHLQEIPTAWDRGKLIVIPTDIREELSQASTKITKDYMKRFAEWLDRYFIKKGIGVYAISLIMIDDDFKLPKHKYKEVFVLDELIEIFLYNENK